MEDGCSSKILHLHVLRWRAAIKALIFDFCFVPKFKVFWSSSLTCTLISWGRRGRDRMVAGFTTTYAISAYHH
jgi:hypothetical protein